jgi:hypothetical protein
LLPEDLQRLSESEFYQGVQPGDMVEVIVAYEKEGGFLLADIPVCLGDTIPGIKNDIIVIGLYQHGAGIPGQGIIPAVGSKEGNVHLDLNYYG